jgi:hypothetical protein
VSGWLLQAADLRADQVVAISPLVATAVVSSRAVGPKAVELLLQAEALTEEAAARGGVLSWQVRLQADCAGAGVKLGATTGYGTRRPAGAGVALSPPEADWRHPKAGSTLHAVWRSACDPAFQPPLAPSVQPAARIAAPAPPQAQAVAALGEPTPAAPALPRPAAPARAAAPKVARAPLPPIRTAFIDRADAPPGLASVQVVSAPTAAGATTRLTELRGRFAQALAGRALRVETAQVKGRTTYRGIIAGFPSRAAAAEFCERLRRDRQACLVR